METIHEEIDLTYGEFLELANQGAGILRNILESKKNYYEGILCPLRGGFYFADFLSRRTGLNLYYIAISSYGNSREQKDFIITLKSELVEGKRYLICEDIVATGNTVRKIQEVYPGVIFEVMALFKHGDRTYPFPLYAIKEISSRVWVNFFWEKI